MIGESITLDIMPKSKAGKVAVGVLILGAVAVRAITYPVRYAWWLAKGNRPGRFGPDDEPRIRL